MPEIKDIASTLTELDGTEFLAGQEAAGGAGSTFNITTQDAADELGRLYAQGHRIHDVYDYGATGNSGDDASDALEDAAAAAGARGVVIIPPGDHRITRPLNQLRGQRWLGMGTGSMLYCVGVTGIPIEIDPATYDWNQNEISHLRMVVESGAGMTRFISVNTGDSLTVNLRLTNLLIENSGGTMAEAVHLENVVSLLMDHVVISGTFSSAAIKVTSAGGSPPSYTPTTLVFDKLYCNNVSTPYGLLVDGALNAGPVTLRDCVTHNCTTAGAAILKATNVDVQNFYSEGNARAIRFGDYGASKLVKYVQMNGITASPASGSDKGILIDYVDHAHFRNLQGLSVLSNANWFEYGRINDVTVETGGDLSGAMLRDHIRYNANAAASNGLVLISGGGRDASFNGREAPSITMLDTTLGASVARRHWIMQVDGSGAWAATEWEPTAA